MVVNLPVPKTRLAPSPTGALHLGNARTFLINWLLARKQGWHIVMRIEDLDGPRLKQGAAEQAIDDLQWLGLDWDEPSPPATYTQRADLTPYLDALTHLQHLQLLYPCSCTRTQIENALSAPHADDHELRYPGTCRPENSPALSDSIITMHHQSQAPCDLLTLGHDRPTALRLIIPDEPITFTDQIHGPITCNVQQQVGDFVVLTKLGYPAYQLAVVVDDARQGITHIVRGDDLLSSTARQLLLYQFLHLSPAPHYWHLPLVLGHDGKRLAKRHGDSRLAHYRSLGVPPQKILGLLACWTGLQSQPVPIDLPALLSIFDICKLPRTPAIFTPEHHQWLITK
ncbi:MAG: tRNA glutamyl-Q(34) synthetase GluQRS [Phycisphaerales bacterium]|nr:tRNA glutamyl-Q(34) synthetase GluQRS [Phycisphaerales bacterium]